MDETERALRLWCENVFAESPIAVSIWIDEDDIVQSFLQLDNRIVICDLSRSEEGGFIEEDTLVIRLANWQPGSIQTRRMPDGMVRFRHRNNEILLAPKVRPPEWASALLEEWLMDMRGDSARPKDKRKRISDMKRRKETITRMLEQADLSPIIDEIAVTTNRLNAADDRLSGRRP